MSSPYEVVSVDVSEVGSALVRLWTGCFEALREEAAAVKIDHFYRRNPAGRSSVFLLRHCATQSDVGVQTLVVRRFLSNGRTLLSGTMADYAVDPAHRSLGPALQLLKASIASSRTQLAFLYGLPNRKAEPILRRAGLEPILRLGRYAAPVRSRQYLHSKVPFALLPTAALLANLVLTVSDWLRLFSLGGRVSWRNGLNANADLETIWSGGQGGQTISDRSAALLFWRFGFPPAATTSTNTEAGWRIDIASTGQDCPLGYVIWGVRNEVAIVGDFLCVRPAHDTARVMAAFKCLARAAGAKAISLEFCGNPAVETALGAAGFSLRETSPIYAVLNEPSLSPVWYLTGFDRDTD
jgi:hypothetical protein